LCGQAGEVVLPDDKLGVGDPAWSFEGLSLELRIAPGQYPVYIAIACAVLEDAQVRRNCAVAELRIDEPSLVSKWELVPATLRTGERGGFWTEGGSSFGPAALLASGPPEWDLLDPVAPTPPWWFTYDTTVPGPQAGQAVAFSVGPQHQECITFVGRTSDERVVSVITDLGLLDLDPRHQPLPWH